MSIIPALLFLGDDVSNFSYLNLRKIIYMGILEKCSDDIRSAVCYTI